MVVVSLAVRGWNSFLWVIRGAELTPESTLTCRALNEVLRSKETTRDHGHILVVCVCVLAGVIFNWLRSAGVRDSYTLQPRGCPSVKSWTMHAGGCRTGPPAHIKDIRVCAWITDACICRIGAWLPPCPVFTLCLYKGSKWCLLLSDRKLFLAAARYWGFPSCFSGLRWQAKQFNNMMDAAFAKLVAVSQLVLWKKGLCHVIWILQWIFTVKRKTKKLCSYF